jgi:GNAT superfamily N-acetyltransferase
MTLARYVGDIRSFPEDAVRAWRAGGWTGVRDEIRRRTLDRVGGYVRRVVVEADLSGLVDLPSPDGVDIRRFSGPDWLLLGDMARSHHAPRFHEAAAAGRTCLVAWKQRQAVGYVWFSPAIEGRHETYDLQLPPYTNYIWQIEVVRREARHGVASALLSRGLKLSWDEGFQRSWMIVHPKNVGSLRAIASVAPTRVLGTMARIKVLSWMRSWYRSLSAPVSIELTLPR